MLVSGGTGTGKTTLLCCLLGWSARTSAWSWSRTPPSCSRRCRTVSGCEARPANVEGGGGVTLRDLVRQALRMRPDRLVLGEVRGAEVVDLLAAFNTGHEGGSALCTRTRATTSPPGSRRSPPRRAGPRRRARPARRRARRRDPSRPGARRATPGRRGVPAPADPDGLVGTVPGVSFTPDGRVLAGDGAAALAARLGGRWQPPVLRAAGARP